MNFFWVQITTYIYQCNGCALKSIFSSPGLNAHLIMAFNFDSPASLPDLMDFNHQIWSLNENQLSGSARDAPLAASSVKS